MIAPSEHDDLAVPPALATALRQAAATVPPAEHDVAGVRRRAQRHRRRRLTATSVAAAAALLLGGIGVHRLVTDEDADVVVPTSVSGWQRTSQDETLHIPTSVPEGWTLAGFDSDFYPDPPDGPSTSQLFAADGRPPLGRGVVVTSRAAEEGESTDATETVRGQPGTIERAEATDLPADTLYAYWIEDGAFHETTAMRMSEAELSGFFESLVPKQDPTTGFTAPTNSALPELDAVTARDESSSFVSYHGPSNAEISVTVENGGAGILIGRLAGEPSGDALVIRDLDDRQYPLVRRIRQDGWAVTAAVEAGSPDPALLEAFVGDVEETSIGQLVDSGALGPATTLATLDGMTVEVHGTDAGDLAVCLTPATGGSTCSGVVDQAELGYTSASLVVDGEWVMVGITDGDEPGQFLGETEPDPTDFGDDGHPLEGERTESDGRIIDVVTVPDDVDNVVAQSPMTDAGSHGHGYHRPE